MADFLLRVGGNARLLSLHGLRQFFVLFGHAG
jgi:hypothetical protein